MALHKSSSPQHISIYRDLQALSARANHYAVRSFDRQLQTLGIGELDTFRPAWAIASGKKHYAASRSWAQQRTVVFPRVNKHLLYANLNKQARNSQEKVASLLLRTYSPPPASHRHCFSVLRRGVAAHSRRIITRFPRIQG